MENEKKVSFQLLVLIATPKLADRAAEMFRKGALPLQYRFHAEGTATSEIMDVLGLGNIDKSVLISMIPKNLSEILLNKLSVRATPVSGRTCSYISFGQAGFYNPSC